MMKLACLCFVVLALAVSASQIDDLTQIMDSIDQALSADMLDAIENMDVLDASVISGSGTGTGLPAGTGGEFYNPVTGIPVGTGIVGDGSNPADYGNAFIPTNDGGINEGYRLPGLTTRPDEPRCLLVFPPGGRWPDLFRGISGIDALGNDVFNSWSTTYLTNPDLQIVPSGEYGTANRMFHTTDGDGNTFSSSCLLCAWDAENPSNSYQVSQHDCSFATDIWQAAWALQLGKRKGDLSGNTVAQLQGYGKVSLFTNDITKQEYQRSQDIFAAAYFEGVGAVYLRQSGVDPMVITSDISNCAGCGTWHIHTNGLTGNSPADCSTLKGHYQPIMPSDGVFESGDLSGKCGSIVNGNLQSVCIDQPGFVSLHDVIGRGMVLHGANGSRLHCASIFPWIPDHFYATYGAEFTGVKNGVTGEVWFEQLYSRALVSQDDVELWPQQQIENSPYISTWLYGLDKMTKGFHLHAGSCEEPGAKIWDLTEVCPTLGHQHEVESACWPFAGRGMMDGIIEMEAKYGSLYINIHNAFDASGYECANLIRYMEYE